MSIDVLAYNSLSAEIKPLRNAVNALQCCIDTTNASISAVQGSITTQLACCACVEAQVAANATSLVANAGPNQAHLWCLIPTGSSWTGGVLVCDTSGNFRCGATCTWTVPGGVTCARFQIWGAGAGTGSGCCCGGSSIGGTGAYASVIMPVSAGWTYTLCAGCAFCCYACRAQNDADGCASFVTGCNLSNFCAEGGEGSMFCEAITRCIIGAAANSYCMYFGCLCNSGSDFCWSNYSLGSQTMCCWDQILPMISSCKTYFGSATGGTVYGIRGSFGLFSIVCTGGICVAHPPIYGFPSTSCCNCQVVFNYRQGMARSACAGFMQIPGAGGWAGFKCGSNVTNCAGDAGRMGMVCVSFR
jgi:hypothetical protein